MDAERPNLSTTLPRNFMFHYRDGPAPQTPEPEPQPEQLQPPPPPRQVLKVRRRRATLARNYNSMDAVMDQQPIPTIEAPEIMSETSSDLAPYSVPQNDAFLSPGFGFNRMLSPPKTPVAQMRTISHYEGPRDWSDIPHVSQSESSSRPTSSSGFSDSSVSSCDSIGSFMSRSGSCTSLEDESSDPFAFCPPTHKSQRPVSPSMATPQPRLAKKLKLRASFNQEMDHHLWMTYMKYLQDPTVTPFKALPSTTPPNGVCHRVARMARKTWKGPKHTRAGPNATPQYNPLTGTPSALRSIRGGNNTPFARPTKSSTRFPSEKQCRKRLRDLAKQKPTLSAHYQRMLRRSPSPLQSSPPPEPEPQPTQPQQQEQQSLSSPFLQGSTSFSTRDMNLSLATSTAASMQLGNPLSQLANDITPRPSPRTWSSARSSAHQKSQSLHIGLGLGNVLGSPFHARSESTNSKMNQSNARTWHAPSSSTQTPRLGSPFQLHAPRPKSRVFKRRALHNSFEDRARNRGESFVNEIFGAPAESSHRRVRSRGFSLGDMMEGARRHLLVDQAIPSPERQSRIASSRQLHSSSVSRACLATRHTYIDRRARSPSFLLNLCNQAWLHCRRYVRQPQALSLHILAIGPTAYTCFLLKAFPLFCLYRLGPSSAPAFRHRACPLCGDASDVAGGPRHVGLLFASCSRLLLLGHGHVATCVFDELQ